MTIKNMKRSQYLAKYPFTLVLLVILLPSCSSDELNENIPTKDERIELSISFTSNIENSQTRSVGTPSESENKIYHLMVLIFNTLTGERDGFAETSSQTAITEIKEIGFTAGVRDVYVIANPTPITADNLRSVETFDDFTKIENSYMGLYEQGGTID